MRRPAWGRRRSTRAPSLPPDCGGSRRLELAVNLQLGGRLHGDGDVDHSVSMTGAWQPSSGQLLFSRVNHDGVQTLHEVGMRLWLRAQRISLDASMPTDLAQDGDRARVVLAWRGFRL